MPQSTPAADDMSTRWKALRPTRGSFPSNDDSPTNSPRQDESTKRDAVRAGRSVKVRWEKSWRGGDPTRLFNGGAAGRRRPLRRRYQSRRLQTRTNSPFRRFHSPLNYLKNNHRLGRRALPTVADLIRPNTWGLSINFHFD